MLNLSPTIGLAAFATLTSAAVASDPPPIFGDWFYKMPDNWRDPGFSSVADRCNAVWESVFYEDEATYIPVNQPGGNHGGPGYHGTDWLSNYAICVTRMLDRMGAPIAIMIRNRNCPFPYGPGEEHYDPEVVAEALDGLPKLDYLLMDLELPHSEGGTLLRKNVEAIVELVRSHPNPRIRNARIGNYNDWPGAEQQSMIWPQHRDRTAVTAGGADHWDRESFYHANFDVAMPVAYPSEVSSRHSDTSLQGEHATPNDRAAMFWSPLESVSVAARNLPEGHMLIPWITNYLSHNGGARFYHAPPPSADDLRALVHHYRMRGATSFMIWTGDKRHTLHPTIDYQAFRTLAIDAWSELDGVFESAERVEFLNLETDKKSGLQWSGIRAGSSAYILVSNMHHAHALPANLPTVEGLPEQTPPVAPGEHKIFVYDLSPAARDYDDDGDLDFGDFVSFVTKLQTGERDASDTVGGAGTFDTDIDANGIVDLMDVIAVAGALRDGKFSRTPPRNNRNRTRSYASVRPDSSSMK